MFQPHRYTRTKFLYERFVIAFNDADVLIVAPLYSAGERPIEGVDSEWLYRGIKEHGHKEVILCKDQDEMVRTLMGTLTRGDVLMTLGAGDIYHLGESVLEQLTSKQ